MTDRLAVTEYPPRLLSEPEAARYIGVSRSTLRKLELPRRVLGGRKLYDRIDLDAYASELPLDGEPMEDVKCADQMFGVTS